MTPAQGFVLGAMLGSLATMALFVAAVLILAADRDDET